MSRCSYCGNELLTGDFHWQQNICNTCYNKINNNHRECEMVELFNDEIYKLQIEQLTQQLSEKDKEIVQLKEDYEHCNNLRKLEVEKNNNYHNEKYNLDKPIEEIRKLNLSFPEKEWYIKGFDNCERQFASHIASLTLELEELKQQLEATERMRQEAIDEGLKCEQQHIKNQNIIAIEELAKVQDELYKDEYFYHNIDGEQYDYGKIDDFINQRINELRGRK